MDTWDVENLRLPPQSSPSARRVPDPIPRLRPGEKFLKGPIPLRWLQLAGKQPGKAMHLAVHLWHLAGLLRSRKVKVSISQMAEFGADRYATYRALRALEKAGLIAVWRHRGRNALVTLNDIPDQEPLTEGWKNHGIGR